MTHTITIYPAHWSHGKYMLLHSRYGILSDCMGQTMLFATRQDAEQYVIIHLMKKGH